jgi:hypothetical protein
MQSTPGGKSSRVERHHVSRSTSELLSSMLCRLLRVKVLLRIRKTLCPTSGLPPLTSIMNIR